MNRKEQSKAATHGENSEMTVKLQVFVSSVQKELEDERLIVQNLLNTDAFLSVHCTPVL
jgi:hypothetical protein